MCVTEVLILAVQIAVASGRLTILTGREETTFTSSNRELVCISDDDGAALTWNSNLNWKYSYYKFSDREDVTPFKNPEEPRSRSPLNCELNQNGSCTSFWSIEGWSLTNSSDTPMGPVFDRRWEGFQEINIADYYAYISTIQTSTLVVSIRGTVDSYILICKSNDFTTELCYWIIIGGWKNSKSVIRKCAQGVPRPPNYPEKESSCQQERDKISHTPLSPLEWKTFVLTWNESTRNISVYDSERMILTFVDSEDGLSKQNTNYHLFLRSTRLMMFRFHSYNFLRTTEQDAILVSPELSVTTTNFCAEMAVGLCAECQLELTLVDPPTTRVVHILEVVKGSRTVHGLPAWQYVRVNASLPSGNSRVKLKMVAILKQKTPNPLWAVANVRSCPLADSIRKGRMKATQDYFDLNYYWPNVTCQKLFYNENTVVNSLPLATFNMEFADSDCQLDRVGPYCSISCTKDLYLQEDCKNVKICEETGCTCSLGYIGSYCEKRCSPQQYGYHCNQTCGLCVNNDCNFRTGECTYGCDHSRGYKVPPFCRIAIDPPSPPTIDFLNETTVRVYLPVKEEYKSVSPSYTFQILKEVERNEHNLKDITMKNNLIQLIVYTLQPGLSYSIRCSLQTDNSTIITGQWSNFTTNCNPSTSFNVEPKNTSLILNSASQDSTSCPAKWYDVVFENRDTVEQIHNGRLSSLPHEFKNLTPYTVYKIQITREGKKYFSREVRTLEAAPSKVRNVKREITSRILRLNWDRPLNENGNITIYKVVLKTTQYFGCDKYDSPQKELTINTTLTTIELSDVAPYAEHSVKISACNSFCSNDWEVSFRTPPAEIPSEAFSNVGLERFVLSWSPPEDCTTITGVMKTRIIITGVSKAVKQVYITKRTERYNLNLNKELHGAEDYVAKIYVIRNWNTTHNESAGQTFFFTTPPKAPPAVRDLEAYEYNVKNRYMFLRWKEPEPPHNGKIIRYHVKCRSYELGTAYPQDYCELWKDYICAPIQFPYQAYPVHENVEVSAENEKVSNYGKAKSIIVWEDHQPSQPEVFRLQALPQGLVDVTWSHPWRTGRPLSKFILSIKRISTNLRTTSTSNGISNHEYLVKNYQIEYNDRLYLMPSTTYSISIFVKTTQDRISEEKFDQVQTPPAVAFEKELTLEVHNESSLILLHIPVVLNDTQHSVMHVIVKGSQPCVNSTKASRVLADKVGIDYYDTAWRAATFPTNKFAYKPFTVGDNELYGGARNCPLKPQEPYVIAVLVTEEESQNGKVLLAKSLSVHMGEVPNRPIVAWLLPIIVALILVAVVFYLYRRQRMKRLTVEVPQEEIVLAANSPSQEDKQSLNSNRILTTTPIAPRKQYLSRVDTLTNESLLLAGHDDSNQKENNSSLVKVKDFEDYVKQAIESGLLDKQYNTMPRGQTKPWDYGKLPQNKPKNRYANLIAYDENRVILEKLPDDPHSDYINANYIKGYKKERCYIATQGPKPCTVNDFWRMVWQEESLIICMLANVIETGKTKCEQYWPDIGKKKKYGDLIVHNAKHTVYADYTFRTLYLTRGEETRKIEHLHYTAWPDHGVPLSTHSVVTYLKKLLATSPGNGPAVVHCSAGVGRTGTIILCDICLRRAATEGMVDVFAETACIRSQRANMVDTKQQYLLAHLTLLDCLLSISTSLPCDEVLHVKINELKNQLPIQQQSLEKAIWQDQALRPAASQMSLSKCNLNKNRFPELASAKTGRVYLKRYPPTDEDSDYISAVYVDGVKMQNQYIATQLPMPGTLGDFWRMVAEYKIELIVALQPPDPDDPTCCSIVPSSEFKPVSYINIKTKETITNDYYSLEKLTLTDNMAKPPTEIQVTIATSTEWKPGRNQDPPSIIALVTLWQATEKIARGDGPTVVLCHDGVNGCGLYLALNVLLERMAVERECDVCLASRAVRRSNHNFVRSREQMEYLYDAAITYLKYFETYANFA